MPRTLSRLAPQFEALEAKMVLSTVSATATTTADMTLTPGKNYAARVDISIAVVRQALTGDTARADQYLQRAVDRLPNGSTVLPMLEAELAAADLTVRGAARSTRKELFNSLDSFIRDQVAAGDLTLSNYALKQKYAATTDAVGSYSFQLTKMIQPNVTFVLTQVGNSASPQSTSITASNSPFYISFPANSSPQVIATVYSTSGNVLTRSALPAVVNSAVIAYNTSGQVVLNFS